MARRGRSGGRAGRAAARAEEAPKREPYIKRNIPTYSVLNDTDLAQLEHNADTILEEIGLDIQEDQESIDYFVKAGATVDGERVRFPRGMCREIVQATAPAEFTQYARNPDNNVQIGGDNTVLVPAYGPPFVYSKEEGRRYANIEDFRNFVKLAYMSPTLHHSGGTVCEPVDLPVNKRHFDMNYSHIKYSDKAFMGSVTQPERAVDTIDMAKIVFGDDFVEENCVLVNLINANSPLTWDRVMLGSLKHYARVRAMRNAQSFCCIRRYVPRNGGGRGRAKSCGRFSRNGADAIGASGRASDLRKFCDVNVNANRGADIRNAGSLFDH